MGKLAVLIGEEEFCYVLGNKSRLFKLGIVFYLFTFLGGLDENALFLKVLDVALNLFQRPHSESVVQ